MVEGIVTVNNPTGLHARPAGDFCSKAQEFLCDVSVERTGSGPKKVCNGKSILSMLTGRFACGTTVRIACEGPDEQKALTELVDLVNNLKE